MVGVTDIQRAVQLLRGGRLVAFPTETVYGLGADATSPMAIERIYRAKGRPANNPLILHFADSETARRYVTDWPGEAVKLAGVFWPGPLTLVLPKVKLIPDIATAGLGTVAIRVPNHPLALELLRAFGGPLAAPSANRSNHVSPTTAEHVREEFAECAAAGGAEENEPAMILDGGACEVGIESTVLDLTDLIPKILRPGKISAADLRRVIGVVGQAERVEAGVARSPGQQEKHYAPVTPTYRFETSQRGLVKPDDHGLVVLSPLRVFKKWGSIIAMPNDPAAYAQHLYAVLRELDGMGLKAIFVEMPPERAEWGAVRDRLIRASVPFSVV